MIQSMKHELSTQSMGQLSCIAEEEDDIDTIDNEQKGSLGSDDTQMTGHSELENTVGELSQFVEFFKL